MSDNITFDENKYKIKPRSTVGGSESSGMIGFLLKHGVIKSDKSGYIFLTRFPAVLPQVNSESMKTGSFHIH